MAFTPQSARLLNDMAVAAERHGIHVLTCAEEMDFGTVGVMPGMCIDADLIRRIWGVTVCDKKDPSQRQYCRCVVSRDIGVNDTCMHGCVYCY